MVHATIRNFLSSVVIEYLLVCTGQVKVQLQARANQQIAVGHQHTHASMSDGLRLIHAKHGVLGLWRGVSSSMPRVTVGSATQLTTYSWCKQKLAHFSVSAVSRRG